MSTDRLGTEMSVIAIGCLRDSESTMGPERVLLGFRV